MKAPRLKPESILFAVFLGALAAFPPISIDLALPALVEIARALGSTGSEAGLTLSLFMAGFAAGPVVYGPLSDARGRKPVLPRRAGVVHGRRRGVCACSVHLDAARRASRIGHMARSSQMVG